MDSEGNIIKRRLSRVALIKETSTLFFNDVVMIRFQHRSAFLLAWTVCKALVQNSQFQTLGGVPPSELFDFCQHEGLNLSRDALNTLWHDEVEFRRHHEMIFSMFEIRDLKNGQMLTQMKPEVLSTILQTIFDKAKPPESSGLHRNIRLFTVHAEPEQILLFRTQKEAQVQGLEPSGRSPITKFRKSSAELGFIDWRHNVKVDDQGSSDSVVSIKMVNLSPFPLLQHMLPIWSDTYLEAESRKLRAWLKDGTELTVDILVGKENKKKIVEFLLGFPRPVQLGETVEFSFSYHTRNAYSLGKGYFTWYFDHPHVHYLVDLKFSDAWVVRDPIVFEDDKDEDIFQVKQLSHNHIKWVRFFPKLGAHYNIYFSLSRQNS